MNETQAWGMRLVDGVFWALIVLVLFSPLPLGSNRPWSWFLLATTVGGLLVVWSSGLLLARQSPPVAAARICVALFLFAGVCVWVLIQWNPWTPAAWHHPLWAEASRALSGDLPGRISVNPEQTLTALVRLLAYAGVFWLSLQLCRSSERARLGLQLFICGGVFYAIYGLHELFSGSEQIFWFRQRLDKNYVTSTLVNRNSYATLAGLSLISASGLFLSGLGGVLRPSVTGRVRVRTVLQQILGSGAPLAVAMLVIATALLLTASRGGVFSTLIGLVALMLAFVRAGSFPRQQLAALSIVLGLSTAALFAFSGDPLNERLEQIELTANGRTTTYAHVVRAIGDAPMLGTGYGTFPDIFPLYRNGTIPGTRAWRRAHNTYLENALELGIPAAGALFAAIGTCAGYCYLGIRRRRKNRVFPSIGVATTALVTAHSSIDFSLQIPAVSVSYAFLLGLACAQSFPTRESRHGGISAATESALETSREARLMHRPL